MHIILALNQGTSSSRAVAFDERGVALASVHKPFKQSYPQPGWVEHDPEELWSSQLACAREALDVIGATGHSVASIGITNQRETTIVWSRRTGHAIYPAIVWQDRRTAEWCDQQRALGLLDAVRSQTGLLLDPYFSASKIAWLLEHVPGARTLAEAGELAFGTIDTWLIWKLTHGQCHVTDVTNASRTMLFNIHESDWDESLCAAFRIPMSMLPKVLPSRATFGTTDLFTSEVTIAGCVGDQQSALYGQGCTGPGQAKNTYGTGCFVLLHTGTQAVESSHGLLTTAAAQTGATREYALEGAVFNAGSVVQWLRDELKLIASSAEIGPLAQTVADTGDVYLVPAFNGLGSPYRDATARGAIVGLTRGTGRAHIARAALESIALQSAEALISMQHDAKMKLSELRVDGGAAANDLLMQIQSDLLGVPVIRPKNLEVTAFGAAALAAHFAGIEDFSKHALGQADVFEPMLAPELAQTKLWRWREAVQRARDWAR